jgi:peptide deformylase
MNDLSHFIIKHPNDHLRVHTIPVSIEVEPIRIACGTIGEQMLAIMKSAGGIGLAATQIGETRSIIVLNTIQFPDTILLNPELVFPETEQTFEYEECLSIPDYTVKVPRYKKVILNARNIDGKRIFTTVEGVSAIVLQHEVDHLHGKLILDYET